MKRSMLLAMAALSMGTGAPAGFHGIPLAKGKRPEMPQTEEQKARALARAEEKRIRKQSTQRGNHD